ncbi:hypothetical protein [Yersinia phage fHe-Yen9-03]|uniref:Uncharacterized protein n=1 Tax=Yersinia phage fHe-Yen9-03 TaxID=2052743 RepID=A0A2C9CZF6_9CAUD|nr:hypothetical protein [Yersinia phage fHe-Yen9-03]
MLWYILVILICISVDVLIWYLYHLWFREAEAFGLKDSFIDVLFDNQKNFWKSVLVSVIIATLICIVPLFKMGSCSLKGFITNANTQYSWVMNECQAKNAAGVYVDIERTRGIPSDDVHDVQ